MLFRSETRDRSITSFLITSFQSVITIIQNSSIMLSASDIKSFQYVLMTKAGRAVSEKREMSLRMIESDVFSEFEAVVKNCVVPVNLKGIGNNPFTEIKEFPRKNVLSR